MILFDFQGVELIEVRKLIGFGKGSYIISMPKGWIEKNNLKKGDLISVSDDGFELTLSANDKERVQQASEISINSKDKNLEMLKAEIVSSYLNGYDSINILFEKNSKDAQKIKDIIRNLSGLEIMEQTSTRILAKNLININEISIKNLIRRMDIITRAMIDDACLCCRGQCNYESINQRDLDVNRLYFLGSRVIRNAMKNPRIAKAIGTGSWQLHGDFLVISRIEKIADRQKRIARFLCNSTIDRNTLLDLDKIFTDIGEAYNEVMKSYYNGDKKTAFELETTHKERTNTCNRILEKYTSSSKKDPNPAIVAKIVENLNATAAEIKNIARTVICYD